MTLTLLKVALQHRVQRYAALLTMQLLANVRSCYRRKPENFDAEVNA
jgi:hypothetical protein